MQSWRTILSVGKSDFQISHTDKSLFMGSCFATNMSDKMGHYGFSASCNPLGILYNSASISKALKLIYSKDSLHPKAFIDRQQQVFHYELHSDLHAKSKNSLNQKIDKIREKLLVDWEGISTVFFTLGTAWVYKHRETGIVVANCHKQDSVLFEKKMMSIDEIIKSLEKIMLTIGKKKQVVFTVSPIRHVKDGLVENQKSKAHLIAAVHKIVESYPNASYFPAYEIMIDDLRDYRFYEKDLIHPNAQAIDYIWDLFSEYYFSSRELSINKEVEKLKKMMEHKPFFDQSEEHQIFKKNLQSKIENFKLKYPYIKI